METFDGVVIAGAGPVGLVTALALAQDGIPVLVLEAGAAIVPSPRAVVYHPPTVEALDRLGVLPAMVAAGLLKHDYQWRTVDGEILAAIDSSVLQPGDTAYPFNLHLGQHRLAAIVLEALLRLDHAQVRWNSRVTAITQDDASVQVTVTGPDGDTVLRAPWLVGGDGAGSGVRQALGLSFDGVTEPEWFVATDIRFDFQAHGFAQASFILDPVHWAVIPKISQDGLWRFTYGEPGDLPRESLRDRAAAKMRAMLPGGAEVPLEAFAPYRVHSRCADSFRVGRVLLAGDAAHIVNPIGGLGLTGGILDAVALGAALASRWHDRTRDGELDRYATERKRIFTDVVAPTAAENKRRLMEADPARRKEDRDRLRLLGQDAGLARQALLATKRLVTHPSVQTTG